MSRRRVTVKRVVIPEPRYGDRVLSKFINIIMRGGKKSVAEGIVYGAMDRMAADGEDPLESFRKALENVRPVVEVKSRRVGGATYQIPIDVRRSRSSALAMRWLVEAARRRPGKGMLVRLADELRDAARGTGEAIKRRESTHSMAEANRAFSHYRW